MTEQDGQAGRWLPLAEAAPILRTTVDGLRKQIRRGKREGRRANSGQWLVRVQAGQDWAGRTAEPIGQPDVDSGPDRLAAVPAELAAALARLDERDRRLVHLEGEVAFLRAELERRRWRGIVPALRRLLWGEG